MTAPAPRSVLLSDLFDVGRLAESTPLDLPPVRADQTALTDSNTELNWAEAIDRVGRLAAVLTDCGVGAGDRVGIRMAKSVDSFVSVHAILRCGAVMVPLDPMAPPAQAAAVIVDADISLLIADTRTRLLAEVIDATDVMTVVLPQAGEGTTIDTTRDIAVVCGNTIDDATPHAAPISVDPDEPAYIIYTSGSTGQPKGIVHTHASGLAYARAAARQYDLSAADRLANIAPLHFDQSTFELYAGPLVGATVLAVPDPVIRFPASLSELISTQRITVWYSVPYVLEQMSTRGGLADRDLSALRWVLYGGESFPPARLSALMLQLPDVTFSNVYGPAEVNQCTVYDLTQPPERAVPIGTAWAESELRVVDPDDERVEVDGTGLLLVATPTMMSHYWKRPDLTAAAIIGIDGRRWYRTGDLVEQRNGLLVFVGRADNQVKVRGHRIELEAIDALMTAVEGVASATTVVRRADNGDDVLVGIVSMEAAVDADELVGTLLGELGARLPRYAVPATIHVVDALPRTTTGKVDRRTSATLLDEPNTSPAAADCR